VNKLFWFASGGLANRCWLGLYFEGFLLHIHELIFLATSNAGKTYIYILFAVLGI